VDIDPAPILLFANLRVMLGDGENCARVDVGDSFTFRVIQDDLVADWPKQHEPELLADRSSFLGELTLGAMLFTPRADDSKEQRFPKDSRLRSTSFGGQAET